MRRLLIPLLMLACTATYAEGPVNKCVSKSRVVFTDKACAAGQKNEPIEAPVTSYSGRESSQRNRAYLAQVPQRPASNGDVLVVGQQSSQSSITTPPPPSPTRVNRLHY